MAGPGELVLELQFSYTLGSSLDGLYMSNFTGMRLLLTDPSHAMGLRTSRGEEGKPRDRHNGGEDCTGN